ncbi:MAG: recombinase family protein [Candidatus Gottesmanbacteria bacterium]
MEHTQINPLNAVSVSRVSSKKQGMEGDSPEDQSEQIARFTSANNIIIKKTFTYTESASHVIQPLQEAVDYCKDPKNDIQLFIVKSIDRFTRGGSFAYTSLKSQLIRYGVKLVDLYGIVGSQDVNTLDHLNIKYDWSVYSPTFKSEILEAERAKDEVRDILTRMIGAEIRYTRLGYWVGSVPMGYQEKKIDTEHGKRFVLDPHPIEGSWIIKMFELASLGTLSKQEIVDELNRLGFKTRTLKVHDHQDRDKVIGLKQGHPLTIRQLDRYLQNPIYAGINCGKWVKTPIKCKFPGLVTISLFNKANGGKIFISEETDAIRIYKGHVPMWQLKKDKSNPNYPYRRFVLCPVCHRAFLGSASRGKSGELFPAYHCGGMRSPRDHKYFRVPVQKLEQTIENFVKKLKFSDAFKKKFKEIVIEEWEKRETNAGNDTVTYNQRLINIENEITALKDKIKLLSTPDVISMFEDDIGKLKMEKIDLIQKRDNKEDEQVSAERIINNILYFMEHLEELILSGDDKLQNADMFGLVFTELPTYQDLIDGTPKLEAIFKLNEAYNTSENQLALPA